MFFEKMVDGVVHVVLHTWNSLGPRFSAFILYWTYEIVWDLGLYEEKVPFRYKSKMSPSYVLETLI